MNLNLLITCFLLFISLSSLSAQKEGNIWYFGKGLGLDFNGDEPQLLKDGAMFTDEGCASISDHKGNLLFYTDGRKVWNQKHEVMPNGEDLMGHISATQSAVIIPKPRSRSTYYIFTVDAAENEFKNGLSYTEINMVADNGYGAVKIKNIPLAAPTCEKVTAVVHENQKDFWVITHEWGTDRFFAFLVTERGVDIVPYVTSVGSKIKGDDLVNGSGYLKASPNGKRLALTIYSENRVELYDFDNSTGEVSNRIKLPKTADLAYGVEFSPDSDKLFVGSFKTGVIEQYDLLDYNQSAISKSRHIIRKEGRYNLGALQLGPDGRIYTTNLHGNYIGVIQNPNDYGTRCRTRDHYIRIGKDQGRLGLPTFIQTYFSTGAINERKAIAEAERNEAFQKSVVSESEGEDKTEEEKQQPTSPTTFQFVVQVKGKIYADPEDPNSAVTGLEALKAANLSMTVSEKEINYQLDADGEKRLQLKQDEAYHFKAAHPGYLNNAVDYLPEPGKRSDTLVIILERVFPEKEITLENIYYDYDKADLRPEAFPPLDNLYKILQDNPDIRIQLSSHTDCRGEDDYNEDLSQRRAQSVVDYLISKGISTELLVAKGYGENAPAVDCDCGDCSEEEHQANRRTTFKVLKE